MLLPRRVNKVSGREGKEKKIESPAACTKLALKTNITTGLLLLLIACTHIALPEMPENTKGFLLVAFASVALLQGE